MGVHPRLREGVGRLEGPRAGLAAGITRGRCHQPTREVTRRAEWCTHSAWRACNKPAVFPTKRRFITGAATPDRYANSAGLTPPPRGALSWTDCTARIRTCIVLRLVRSVTRGGRDSVRLWSTTIVFSRLLLAVSRLRHFGSPEILPRSIPCVRWSRRLRVVVHSINRLPRGQKSWQRS